MSSNATSKVGNAQIHEAGDQRNTSRFHEGQSNSHQALDSKDERTIANKLEREALREKEGEHESVETQQVKQDPLLPAKSHGNEPSRGAKIDADIRAEEEEQLRNRDKI